MTLDHTLIAGVALFSVLAALSWLRSALAKVVAPLKDGKPVDFLATLGDEPGEYRVIADGVDLFPTMALQSRWNARAAAAACVAAALQGWQAALHW